MEKQALKTKRHYGLYRKKSERIHWKEQGKKQIELSRITGIPASTLTGYVKGTSLPVPENLEKIAAFFQVAVAEIDPSIAQ